MIAPLVIDVAVLGGIWVLGLLLTRALLGQWTVLDALSVAFPLSGGVLTWVLFLLSWVGVRLSGRVVAAAWMVLAVAAVLLALRTRRPPTSRPVPRGGSHWILYPAWASILGLVGAAAALAVGRSHSTWDAIAIYAVKGYGIALEGTVYAAAHWGPHGLTYPLNLPLWIAIFRMADGDVLPGSKLVSPLVYLCLVLACYTFLRRQRLREPLPSLGALLVASVPLVFEHATMGYANLLLTHYLVMGVLAAVVGAQEESPRRFVLSGIHLALAAWTRPEGLVLSASAAAAMLLAWRLAGRRMPRLLPWLLPALLIAGPWQVFVRPYAGESQVAQVAAEALSSLVRGEPAAGAVLRILRFAGGQALRPSVWGMAFPVCAAVMLVRFRQTVRGREPVALALLLATAGICLMVVVFYWMASYAGPSLDWWLGTGFNRMMMPAAVLGVIVAALTVSPAPLSMPQFSPERNLDDLSEV